MLVCNCIVGMSLLDKNKRKLVSIHPLLPPVMPLAIDGELNNQENNQETLPVLINPDNGTKSYDKGNIIPPRWQLKWSFAILLLLCKDVTSLCACVRTHVFCVRQRSLGISTGSKTKQTLRTYKWADKTCMLKMQTRLSNTKQCYIRISLNIRKRVKDIISARTSSRFRVEVSEIWGLEIWESRVWGFWWIMPTLKVLNGIWAVKRIWLTVQFLHHSCISEEFFHRNSKPKYINQEWSNKPAVQPTLFQASSSPKTSATSFCSSTSFLEICTWIL